MCLCGAPKKETAEVGGVDTPLYPAASDDLLIGSFSAADRNGSLTARTKLLRLMFITKNPSSADCDTVIARLAGQHAQILLTPL